MFSTKNQALQWRIKKREEMLAKLERLLREINSLEREIEIIHSNDAQLHIYETKIAKT